MAKSKSVSTTAKKHEYVKFYLENDEITLLEFKQWYYTGYENEEFFNALKNADLLDDRGFPTKKSIDNRFIYFKEGEPNTTLQWEFYPEGRRLVVGEHEYLSRYLEFMEQSEEFIII